MPWKSSGNAPVVVAVFTYPSEARRALIALREKGFTQAEVAAAFREPASQPELERRAERSGAEPPAWQRHERDQWFSRLRDIYHGESAPNQAADRKQVEVSEWGASGGSEAVLSQLNLPEREAALLDRELERGAAVVTVQAGARNREAESLLEQRGARIVHGQVAASSPALAASSAALPDAAAPQLSPAPASPVVHSTPFTPAAPAPPDHIQLYGEVLRVHKEKVSSGEVRVDKEAVTRMETVQVPVTREELVVRHADATGEATENAIRIPLSEERVHVDKDTVLRQEYRVGKREVTQNESVKDAVRKERLIIDDGTTKARD